MRRRKTVKEIVTDADHKEGFTPQKLEEVLASGRVVHHVKDDEVGEREPLIIYKRDSDVPAHMRRHTPPEPVSQNPNAPSVNEQAAAIKKLIARTAERRRQDTLKRLKDPNNSELISKIGEVTSKVTGGRAPYVKPVKVEETTDDSGKEETRSEA